MASSHPSKPILFKRESSVTIDGLVTPSESIPTTGTITPSHESIDRLFPEVSNTVQGVSSSATSTSMAEQVDEGYQTQAPDRKLRLESPTVVPMRARTPQPYPATTAQKLPGASLQIVGEQVNLLVDAIEELRKLGLKEIDTELPELVLIGDQSAGKSSLMGAIAEINLPKNMGMCTRCPANIKTSPADIWSCKVSLHEYFHYSNDARRGSTRTQPFPPWRENEDQSLTVRHFKTVSDKSELEEVLLWAQIALLNPSQDYHAFIPGTGAIAENGLRNGQEREADFSPNIVAIEISGPRLPALSFYDLPGIFVSAATKEEQYLIKVFENLATKYIKHENALIILAMSMANDPGLSKTSAIVEQQRAGKRTIGVLTMPDRLQGGSTHMDFDAILKGTKHSYPRGYFVTKQPGPDFVPHGDYHSQARKEEAAFFEADPLWSSDWRTYRDRCGTEAIQGYLSQEFARLIAQSMPGIDEKIKAQAGLVNAQLAQLPELPDNNVQHVVRQCLQQFSNGVQRLLEGGSASNEFLSTWTQLSTDFAETIQIMKPMFIVSDPSDSVTHEVINLDDDTDDSSSMMPSPRPQMPKRPVENPVTPQAKRPKMEFGSPSPLRRPSKATKATVFDPYHQAGKKFMTITEVRTIIAKHRRPGHPGIVTDAAREEICLLSLDAWSEPLMALSNETYKMLKSAITSVMNQTLGHYKQTDMFRSSEQKINDFLDSHQRAQDSILESLYKLETYKLFTLNEPAFLRYQEEELKILRRARRDMRARAYAKRQALLSRKPLTDAAKNQLERSVTDDELGPDTFKLEIETAAYVRGYYKTAGYRFADNLCQSILGNLLKNIHKDIPFLLEKHFDLNNGDSELKCRNLMIEDHGEAVQRLALQDQKNKLSQAAERLAKLVQELEDNSSGMGIHNDADDDDTIHSEDSQMDDYAV